MSENFVFSFPRAFVATVLASTLFLIFPSLDLATSSLFYQDTFGFLTRQSEHLQFIRHIIWGMTVATFVICGLCAIAFNFKRAVDPRPFEIAAFGYLLGPGILVNGILKAYWGRARPYNVQEFGGSRDFTLPYEIADQCAFNCSFTSGEAAGSAAMLLSVLLVLAFIPIGDRLKTVIAASAWVLAIVGVGIRVAMGGHFLSDAVLSVLFVWLCFAVVTLLPRYRTLPL